MRRRFATLTLVLGITIAAGCTKGTEASGRFDTPEATFETVVSAVRQRNLDLYRRCFSPTALERDEAMIAKIEKKPERTWGKLEGIFRGPQALTDVKRRDGRVKATVEAPEAEGGGIGGITFEKVGPDWKIRAW